MHARPAIEIENVTKTYRTPSVTKTFTPSLAKKTVLDGVSLTVPQGAVFGFLGPNGAGKTTLIKVMVGIVLPDSGRCTIYDSHHHSLEKSSKRTLGYFPERPYFHDFLTAAEFLRFHGRLVGMDDAEIDHAIGPMLERVDLKSVRDAKLRTFSKGMLQRIGIAQALLHDPDVLVFDEPMSGLDPVGRREVRDIITDVAKAGKTIFFSTHIVHDIEVICTSVGFINKGRLKGSGNIEDLLGKTIKSMEIRYGLPAHKHPASSELAKHSRKTMDGWVIEIESHADALEEEVNTAISKILHEKGQIKAVTPRKSTLEDLFFEEAALRRGHK